MCVAGEISGMLRQHGYSEWNETDKKGSMIGASYDWRYQPCMQLLTHRPTECMAV